ncbi:MAG: hypothetical protein K9N48_07020, partial [Verrucomicrobia bacterium]|nr:hypothetical protein [Verrucomicrobiota bacterium]
MKTQSYIPATAARRTPISKQKPKPVLLHQLLMLSIPLFAGIILAPLTTGCTSTPPPKEKPPGLTKAETLTESALKLSRAGNWQTAAEQWKEASGQFALLNDITNQAHALHNLGISRLRLKEFSKAESALAKAAELNSFINRRDRWWFNRIGLLQVYRESNNSIAQAASIESLQSQLQSVSDHEIRGHFFNEAALYEYSKQEFSKASELLDNAEKEFSGIDHIPGLAAVAANKARLLQSQAEHNRALEKWDAALRLSRETADYDGI